MLLINILANWNWNFGMCRVSCVQGRVGRHLNLRIWIKDVIVNGAGISNLKSRVVTMQWFLVCWVIFNYMLCYLTWGVVLIYNLFGINNRLIKNRYFVRLTLCRPWPRLLVYWHSDGNIFRGFLPLPYVGLFMYNFHKTWSLITPSG